MMSKTHRPARPYHHGNLREALVEGAEALLNESGTEKFSLRAVARRIGVSPAAPYAHFENRQALLAAVATRGFKRLSAYQKQAENRSQGSAEWMHSLARGYVRFAVDHPILFRLMFSAELDGVDDEALWAAADQSYAFIRTAVADRLSQAADRRMNAGAGSRGAWALAHGLAMLIVDGKVDWPPTESVRDAMINEIAGVYSSGLL